MTGHLRPNSLQTLKSLSVIGASSIAELDKFDPDNGDHKQIIKCLMNQKFVVSDYNTCLAGEPIRYSLTEKGRTALHPQPTVRPVTRARKHYGAPSQAGHVAGPVRFGSMSTDRQYNPGKDMLAPAARAGADAALAIPSRHGDRLHYRDGRVVCFHTNRSL